MRAVVTIKREVSIRDLPVPVPNAGEVLVRVLATSLNRADLYILEGRSHGAAGGEGTQLGIEWAGEIVAVGVDVPRFNVGDRVLCTGIGGLAEFAIADWRRLFPFPANGMAVTEAACLSVALRTVYASVVVAGGLQSGQSVLVLGASSAVGLMCMQVASLLGARTVIGTSSSPTKLQQLHQFGATHVVSTSDVAWSEKVVAITEGSGVDLTVDFLAGPYFNPAMRATRIAGTIVNVGRMAGESGEFDFDLHSLRRIRYLGQTFRTRSPAEMLDVMQRSEHLLWPAVNAGKIKIPIDRVLPLSQADRAFQAMAENAHFGKIVVVPDEPPVVQ